ncbi:anthranilate phosphoribosyltransferase [Halosquirtibacter laminarini]|uniref:Anthranilate phosphoribosyltransferase n=1 Tax=Halosquirtibacter laminarini TaxID=3374600 RepID=A0AC61NEX1_9BACT|nr:anthranilate phosphoribosyltransferase [Prolixibacteraceae bacterium]
MKEILSYLFGYHQLSSSQAEEILMEIAEGKFTDSEISSFLTVFNMRQISIDELDGFRNALLKLSVPIDLSDYNAIDLCGTGGDGKDTFNISTLTAFVVAGAGYHVAKHGNYGASSSCGSSNVMEYLGYRFKKNKKEIQQEIEETGITFLHAPLFNPAMKHVAPVRRALGLKTFFNMLGPLVNPAQPNNQMVGVFNLELARMYQYLFQKSNKRYTIVHSLDGYDEISLTSPFKLIQNDCERTINPIELGFTKLQGSELASSGDIKGTAKIFTDVLQNKATRAQQEVVVCNAAFAIQTIDAHCSLEEAKQRAIESLQKGAAFDVFKKIISK